MRSNRRLYSGVFGLLCFVSHSVLNIEENNFFFFFFYISVDNYTSLLALLARMLLLIVTGGRWSASVEANERVVKGMSDE